MVSKTPNNRLNELLQKYVAKNIDIAEYKELFNYMGDESNKEEIFSFMDEHHKEFQSELNVNETDWESMYANITSKNKGIAYNFFSKWKVAAAAILVIAGSYATYHFSAEENLIPKQEYTYKNDVAPGSNKAVLTLADGSQITLSDQSNGNLATEGKISIEKDADGKLVYHIKGGADVPLGTEPMKFNTISTPVGGNYSVILSDGSKVWLNAASSLKFPIAFAKDIRKVEITGEAYFEIEKDKNRPFFVKNGSSEIKVLGTHFDVMSYPNESQSTLTLLEGSVLFTKDHKSEVLKPGMQILYREQSDQTKLVKANIEEVMAWKNGLFVFNNTNIDEVMKELVRWYAIDVKYIGDKPDIAFTGVIPRNANVSKVLKALEATGDVKFGIDGQYVICSKSSKR